MARGAGEVTGGVSGRADWIGYDLYNTEARVRTGTEQDDDGRYQSASAFARWRGLLGQRIVYDLGGRFDLLHYNALDQLTPGRRVARRHARHRSSPKLGARYLLSSKVCAAGLAEPRVPRRGGRDSGSHPAAVGRLGQGDRRAVRG